MNPIPETAPEKKICRSSLKTLWFIVENTANSFSRFKLYFYEKWFKLFFRFPLKYLNILSRNGCTIILNTSNVSNLKPNSPDPSFSHFFLGKLNNPNFQNQSPIKTSKLTNLKTLSFKVAKFINSVATELHRKVRFERMQRAIVQLKEKERPQGLQGLVGKVYSEEFAAEFEKLFNNYVAFAAENATDAVRFAEILVPLLRKAMVWIDPEKVQAVNIELGRWNEVIVKIHLPTREIRISKYGAEVQPLEFYTYGD